MRFHRVPREKEERKKTKRGAKDAARKGKPSERKRRRRKEEEAEEEKGGEKRRRKGTAAEGKRGGKGGGGAWISRSKGWGGRRPRRKSMGTKEEPQRKGKTQPKTACSVNWWTCGAGGLGAFCWWATREANKGGKQQRRKRSGMGSTRAERMLRHPGQKRRGLVQKGRLTRMGLAAGCVVIGSALMAYRGTRVGEAANPGPYENGGASSSGAAAAGTSVNKEDSALADLKWEGSNAAERSATD